MSGSVAEWSKALVLGTSHFDGVGSNPTTASNFFTPFTDTAFHHLLTNHSPRFIIVILLTPHPVCAAGST